MKFPYEEFDLSKVKTYPLKTRRSKARAEDFARPFPQGGSVAAFVESLPNVLAAADFKAVVRAIADAKQAGGEAHPLAPNLAKAKSRDGREDGTQSQAEQKNWQ